MFESVYVCRDTEQDFHVTIVPAWVGIVKITGCVEFYAAIKKRHGKYGSAFDDNIEDNNTTLAECRRKYDSVPEKGEAWLVEEGRKFINWTRVDHNMHLLNADGSIVK